ncbi:MAG TPA: SPASM domain-containing protein [Bacilli bacterium]|nr:SPASM domain-containing protein [Bacilli bacterium]
MIRFKKIYIEITNSCNRNCSFCSKTNRIKKEMNLEEFKHVITEIKSFTDYVYLHVKGEPLLHSNFKEIINVCEENNINVNITTNGTLLYKYKEFIINKKCIRQINISLHSYTNLNDLKILFDTIDYINNNSNIYIVYRYWILKENESIKDNIYINSLINYYKINNDIKEKIYNESNIKINETLFINKGLEFIWPELSNNLYVETGKCYGLKTHIGILSDGTVVPCCLDGEGIIALGNIFEKSLEEILNSKRSVEIINSFNNNKRNEELCKHCNFLKNI